VSNHIRPAHGSSGISAAFESGFGKYSEKRWKRYVQCLISKSLMSLRLTSSQSSENSASLGKPGILFWITFQCHYESFDPNAEIFCLATTIFIFLPCNFLFNMFALTKISAKYARSPSQVEFLHYIRGYACAKSETVQAHFWEFILCQNHFHVRTTSTINYMWERRVACSHRKTDGGAIYPINVFPHVSFLNDIEHNTNDTLRFAYTSFYIFMWP